MVEVYTYFHGVASSECPKVSIDTVIESVKTLLAELFGAAMGVWWKLYFWKTLQIMCEGGKVLCIEIQC